jgi:hypothetical protein
MVAGEAAVSEGVAGSAVEGRRDEDLAYAQADGQHRRATRTQREGPGPAG